jgi:outer membrane protein assembly factor BamB
MHSSIVPARQIQRFLPGFCCLALTIIFGVSLPLEAVVKEGVAGRLVSEHDLQRGLAVVLGLPRGRVQFLAELAEASELLIHVQLDDPEQLLEARQLARREGLLGRRITISAGTAESIPLADNLADLVYLPTGTLSKSASDEVMRVLCPGGLAELAGKATRKLAPEGIDDWSHPYHGPDNNPASTDQLARAPYITQFLASPFYGPMPEVTVAAGGKLFKVFGHLAIKEREWPLLNSLVCIHGYNGTELWRRKLEPGFMVHRNLMVATPDKLYLAFKKDCLVIDTNSGETIDKVQFPGEMTPDKTWKWMAIQDGVLYAMLGEEEQDALVLKGERMQAGWPWSGLGKGYAQDEYPWGFGQTLAAMDLKTGKVKWSVRHEEPLDSRATAIRNGRLFYYSEQSYLGSLSLETGKTLWHRIDSEMLEAIGPNEKAQNPRSGFSSSAFLKADDDVIFMAGPQRKNLVAVSAKTGDLLWQHPHGNFQLVIREDGLYAMGRLETSKKFDPTNGTILADLDCFRGNCTRATATVDSIFTRGYRHTGTQRIVLGDEVIKSRIGMMRPACQDGVVVAHGLLYWGPWMCDCNLSLVGVISLAARGDLPVEAAAVPAERLTQLAVLPGFTPAESLNPDLDWVAYRQGNERHSGSSARLAETVKPLWTIKTAGSRPTAMVTVGDRGFYGGTDGAVEAVDLATGKTIWTAYTSGAINYPPALADNHLVVGSADGSVYCFSSDNGQLLWKFQAAPVDRRIPVYGRLSSTWPVGSGVLIDDGVVYAAAGIASYDGTHLYALRVDTGQLVWQNNSSGSLGDSQDGAGVSVQGHMLKHGERLYLAGGNVVSPAVYDASNGNCLNELGELWSKTPRGRELFLVNDKVFAFDRLLYGPDQYQVGRYHAADRFAQAIHGEIIVRGRANQVVRVRLDGDDGKPVGLWQNTEFASTEALAVAGQRVVVVGSAAREKDSDEPRVFQVASLDAETGTAVWTTELPGEPRPWGLAIDRHGRLIITLMDGRLVCLGGV